MYDTKEIPIIQTNHLKFLLVLNEAFSTSGLTEPHKVTSQIP